MSCADLAKSLFGSSGLHGPEYVHQYWGTLASSLTDLDVEIGSEFTEATSAALCQLSNLLCLSVSGIDEEDDPYVIRGHFSLQLPMLEKLSISRFIDVTIELQCPHLKSLSLVDLYPLQALSGMPLNLEQLEVGDLQNGSVRLESIFRSQKLEKLKSLDMMRIGSFAHPGSVWPYCFSSSLTRLTTDCDIEKLFPIKAPWSGLPSKLQQLEVHTSLKHGIPMVLEQLTSLRVLSIRSVPFKSLMHLDRPLDPFLDLPSIESLHIRGDLPFYGYSTWSAPALVLLGQAEKRIADMQRVSGGRSIKLRY